MVIEKFPYIFKKFVPTALGRTRFFALGLICEDFSTRGMKKFPYLKTGPFGNPIFLNMFTFLHHLCPMANVPQAIQL